MDENDFGFDWRETPMKDHPNGAKCNCPKHNEIRENITLNQGQLKIKLCPDHYRVYFNEIFPKLPLIVRLLAKFALAIKLIQIKQIPAMQSDQCFYCRFGSGGVGRKPELPPVS